MMLGGQSLVETGVKVLGHEPDPLADDGEFVDGHGEKIWKYRQYIGKKAQAVTRPGEYWALLGQLVVSTKRQGPKGGSGEPKKGHQCCLILRMRTSGLNMEKEELCSAITLEEEGVDLKLKIVSAILNIMGSKLLGDGGQRAFAVELRSYAQ